MLIRIYRSSWSVGQLVVLHKGNAKDIFTCMYVSVGLTPKHYTTSVKIRNTTNQLHMRTVMTYSQHEDDRGSDCPHSCLITNPAAAGSKTVAQV